jgi:hypothetical protein
MAAELTRLTHKIAIPLHLVAERCTICSYRSRRPVLKLLDTPAYYKRTYGCIHAVNYLVRIASFRLDLRNTLAECYNERSAVHGVPPSDLPELCPLLTAAA